MQLYNFENTKSLLKNALFQSCSPVCLSVMLVSLCLYHTSFFWQPLALQILKCDWDSRCTVIPTSNNSGSLTRGSTISSLDPLVSSSVPGGDEALREHCLSSFQSRFLAVCHCAAQDRSYFMVTSPPLSTAGLATAADSRGCPQLPAVNLSSESGRESVPSLPS